MCAGVTAQSNPYEKILDNKKPATAAREGQHKRALRPQGRFVLTLPPSGDRSNQAV